MDITQTNECIDGKTVRTIILIGNFIRGEADEVRRKLNHAVAQKVDKVLLDTKGVTSIDHVGMGILALEYQRLMDERRKSRLILVDPSPAVMGGLKNTKLIKVIEIIDSTHPG